MPLAILSGAVLGGLTELLVVRRLFHQPRLLLFVATIGVAQVILLVQLQLPEIDATGRLPHADRASAGRSATLTVRGDQLLVLVAVPLIVAVARVLMQRTRFGLVGAFGGRQPERGFARPAFACKAVSTQVWVLAGVLASVSALLAGPVLNQRASDVERRVGARASCSTRSPPRWSGA